MVALNQTNLAEMRLAIIFPDVVADTHCFLRRLRGVCCSGGRAGPGNWRWSGWCGCRRRRFDGRGALSASEPFPLTAGLLETFRQPRGYFRR
jgi:hypothetical protein